MSFVKLLQKPSEDKVDPAEYRVHGCKSSSASALGDMFHLFCASNNLPSFMC